MKNNWIRIDNNIYNINLVDIYFSSGHSINKYCDAIISIKLDLKQNPSYYSYFIKKYEQQSNNYNNSLNSREIKFDLFHDKFVARGVIIKSMDISFNDEMNLDLLCDFIEETSIEERREQIINNILNQTLTGSSPI
jgi:hypothetical protein